MRRLCLLLLCLLLVACRSTAVPPPMAVPPPTPGMLAIPPGPGGTLITTLGARDPNTLDPALVSDTVSSFVIRQLFSGLVRLDAQLQVQPDLAERWDISPDGRVYTFFLRPDARFADGTPVTSADVVYSLERACDPQLARFLPARTYLIDIVGVREKIEQQAASIQGLRAIDARTIEITIDEPKSYFLAKLAHPTSFVVHRTTIEVLGQNWLENPNGSGPFVIEEWEHDQLLVLARNLNYYRDLARLDRVRFLIGAAAANADVLYELGEIDYVEIPAYNLARVRDTSNPLSRELVSVPQLAISYIGMNVTIPPFDDLRVRQAFALLLDRQRVVDVSLYGSGTPARGILPPGMPGYNPQLALAEPDLETVRQLLAASRYGSAEALPPIVAYGGGWATTLSEIAAAELGIAIEVRGFEDFGQYLHALDEGQLAMFSTGWIADYPDPENFVDLLFRSGSAENYSAYSNPQVDQLLDQAAVATDTAQRWELYRQAEQLILADAPVIPVYHDEAHVLIKPYVRGLEVTPMGILDLSTVELVRN